jgi:acyl carrier protein
MKSKIKIILKEILPKGIIIYDKTDLIKRGYLDSFSLMVLITSLEKKFKVKISLAKININYLSSIDKIEKYIKKINK